MKAKILIVGLLLVATTLLSQSTHSTAMLDANNVFTAPQTVSNAGVFTGAAYHCYFCTALGGFQQSSFNTIFLPNVLDAVSGGVTIPVGANVGPNAEGVAGYAVNKADTRSGAPGAPTGTAGFQSNGVSLYGISQAYNNFSSAWGINTTTADNTSTANTFLVGYEADMWVLGTPFVLYGMDVTLNGNTGTVPGGSFGYNISNSRTDGGKFTIGFDANDNCCATALSVGPSGPAGPSVASQNVSWCRYDSGSVRHCDDFIAEDANGNLDVNTAIGKGVILSNGTLIGSGTAGNTDLNGQLTFSASTTSASYSFTGTYTSAPICTFAPLADPGAGVRIWISTLSTSTLQLTASSAISLIVDYQCTKRN